MAPTIGQALGTPADPVITRLVAEDHVPWYKKKNLRTLYFIMFPTCIGVEMTSGFDSSMTNGMQAIVPWKEYFNNPQGSRLGILTAAYSLGAILGMPFIPWVNKRYGRRITIVVGSVIMLIGAALQTASQNYPMFVIARLLLGTGIPFAIVAASSLIGETAYPKERAVLTSLFNASWFIGSIVVAGITAGTFAIPSTWSWRIPSILQCVPSLVQILFMPLMPESPRWLISKDRFEEARAILVKYHAEGDENSELVNAEIAQIQTTIKLEMEQSKLRWRELFSTSGNRRRLLIGSLLGLFTQWSGNTLISYYLVQILKQIGITDPKTQTRINLANTCWGFVNGTIMALAVYKFRRRTMYLTCVSGLLSVYVAWTIAAARYTTTKSDAAGRAVLAFIFIYSPFYNMGYNALTYTFLVELFPFRIRSHGIVVFQFFGRMAGFFTNFVNPIGLKNAGWKYYLSYVCWLVFEIIFIYFMFPETSGRTIEELSFLFESDEDRKAITNAAEKQLQSHGIAEHPITVGKDIEQPTTVQVEKAT